MTHLLVSRARESDLPRPMAVRNMAERCWAILCMVVQPDVPEGLMSSGAMEIRRCREDSWRGGCVPPDVLIFGASIGCS